MLVAEDLGPADIAELDTGVQAVALAGGGATAHAAIVARSLGVPLVAALGEAVLALQDGAVIVVDGGEGIVVAEPDAEQLEDARSGGGALRTRARDAAAAQRALPAMTRDGRRITVLANVAGAAELRLAVDAGAEGVGLLSTELAFLQADAWPTRAQHRRALEPVLAAWAAGPRPSASWTTAATSSRRSSKARASVASGCCCRHRTRSPRSCARSWSRRPGRTCACCCRMVGVDRRARSRRVGPARGRAGRRRARAAAGRDDRDAAGGGHRRRSGAARRLPQHRHERPHRRDARGRSLRPRRRRRPPPAGARGDRRGRSAAARRAGIPIEVCGEAASDPIALPLLVGLGVDELSVGASRVGTVRAWVRELDLREAEELATRALGCTTAEEVAGLTASVAERLAGVERGDASAAGTSP